MNLEKYLSVTPEIQAALAEGKPVVALESTILSHGMPYPQNLDFGRKVEQIIRDEGCVPATIAILDGKMKVGLNEEELERMCHADGVGKVSRRDLATYLATGMPGATTVTTTMIVAAYAGIRFFATGGIGGVHRGAETTMDISADLQELANTPVCVICAGAKSILDLGLTLEYLETQGVPVLGLRTDELPAFYCRTSGFKLDYNCPDEATVRLLHHTAYDFCRLHTGLRHYPRLNTADQIHTGTVVGCFAVGSDHVSGDQQIVHHLRSQSVCRHFPVSQPHDQYRQFLRFPGHHFQKFLR